MRLKCGLKIGSLIILLLLLCLNPAMNVFSSPRSTPDNIPLGYAVVYLGDVNNESSTFTLGDLCWIYNFYGWFFRGAMNTRGIPYDEYFYNYLKATDLVEAEDIKYQALVLLSTDLAGCINDPSLKNVTANNLIKNAIVAGSNVIIIDVGSLSFMPELLGLSADSFYRSDFSGNTGAITLNYTVINEIFGYVPGDTTQYQICTDYRHHMAVLPVLTEESNGETYVNVNITQVEETHTFSAYVEAKYQGRKVYFISFPLVFDHFDYRFPDVENLPRQIFYKALHKIAYAPVYKLPFSRYRSAAAFRMDDMYCYEPATHMDYWNQTMNYFETNNFPIEFASCALGFHCFWNCSYGGIDDIPLSETDLTGYDYTGLPSERLSGMCLAYGVVVYNDTATAHAYDKFRIDLNENKNFADDDEKHLPGKHPDSIKLLPKWSMPIYNGTHWFEANAVSSRFGYWGDSWLLDVAFDNPIHLQCASNWIPIVTNYCQRTESRITFHGVNHWFWWDLGGRDRPWNVTDWTANFTAAIAEMEATFGADIICRKYSQPFHWYENDALEGAKQAGLIMSDGHEGGLVWFTGDIGWAWPDMFEMVYNNHVLMYAAAYVGGFLVPQSHPGYVEPGFWVDNCVQTVNEFDYPYTDYSMWKTTSDKAYNHWFFGQEMLKDTTGVFESGSLSINFTGYSNVTDFVWVFPAQIGKEWSWLGEFTDSAGIGTIVHREEGEIYVEFGEGGHSHTITLGYTNEPNIIGFQPSNLNYTRTWIGGENLTVSFNATPTGVGICAGYLEKRPSIVYNGFLVNYDSGSNIMKIQPNDSQIVVVWTLVSPSPPMFYIWGAFAAAGGSFAYWLYRRQRKR